MVSQWRPLNARAAPLDGVPMAALERPGGVQVMRVGCVPCSTSPVLVGNVRLWEFPLGQVLEQKVQSFPHTNRILHTISYKMLFIWPNLESPGAVFLMKSAGAKPSKNTNIWWTQGIFFLQKVQGTPISRRHSCDTKAIIWRK